MQDLLDLCMTHHIVHQELARHSEDCWLVSAVYILVLTIINKEEFSPKSVLRDGVYFQLLEGLQCAPRRYSVARRGGPVCPCVYRVWGVCKVDIFEAVENTFFTISSFTVKIYNPGQNSWDTWQ